MKPRTTSISDKAKELKVKAFKLLVSKGFVDGEVEALKAIIQIAESKDQQEGSE